jgi:SpoVK/Ycf46/Vps4 family AAA+-type ATPase
MVHGQEGCGRHAGNGGAASVVQLFVCVSSTSATSFSLAELVEERSESVSTKHLLALLNSHIEGDDEQFLSITLQIAAQEARQGRIEEADKLKRLVQRARDRQRTGRPAGGQTPIPLARPRGELQTLVESAYPKITLASMVLADDVLSRLTRVVRQQKERAILRGHGQAPTTHMLLVGPPGTGKTMTASALAGELRLPLFTMRLESMFSRYFGETAGKLRLLFDQIAQTRGVYLLDEFDAIGARRGDPNDVGEIRRVLNSVLAFMEEPNSTDSLVLAATNNVEILDDALARRFDEVIEYTLPDPPAARAIIERSLGKFKLNGKSWLALEPALGGLSQGELVRAAEAVVKDAILEGTTKVSAEALRDALQDRQTLRGKFRRQSGP